LQVFLRENGVRGYLEIALQLSPEEQEQLLQELSNGALLKSGTKRESFFSEAEDAPYSPEEFYEFLLRGPVIDETQIQLMLDAKGKRR